MKKKDCPSCGLEVPKSASRCKSCFHDFTEKPKTMGWAGPLAFLIAFAAMGVVGTATLGYIVVQPLDEKILVDGATKSVIWTTRYRTGVQTDRLRWADIVHIEYVVQRTGGFLVVAVTNTGERKTIQSGAGPIRREAEQYAEQMGKELRTNDETTGFHKMGGDEK